VSGLNLPPDAPLNPELEEDSEENSLENDQGWLGPLDTTSVADLYSVLKGVHAGALTVLCVGAEYYAVHCYTRCVLSAFLCMDVLLSLFYLCCPVNTQPPLRVPLRHCLVHLLVGTAVLAAGRRPGLPRVHRQDGELY